MKRSEASKPSTEELELHPDAWERFEKAVDKVMKVKPKRRAATPAPKPAKSSRKKT